MLKHSVAFASNNNRNQIAILLIIIKGAVYLIKNSNLFYEALNNEAHTANTRKLKPKNLIDIKGELQRENKLISYEMLFKTKVQNAGERYVYR